MKYFRPVLLVLLSFVALRAQDIHPGPLVWLATEDNPDELPVPKGLPSLALSDGLKAMTGPSYMECRLSVTAKGKVSPWAQVPASPWFAHGLPEFSRDFVPAKREGRAVTSEVAVCFIYNPAAAGPKGPDAIPRLLAVQPPIFPGGHISKSMPDRVVRVVAEIDAQGAVTGARAVDEGEADFADAAVVAVRRWSFAPARKAGQSVPATLEVPVVFRENRVLQEGEVTVPPKSISRVAPVYPAALRRAGLSGEVIIKCVISVEGRVTESYALRSSHPAFEDAAIVAMRQWKFQPAMQDGRPVPCTAMQMLQFAVDGDPSDVHGFQLKVPKSWPDGVPEKMRFEVAPELEYAEMPVYPLEDLQAKREGKVTVAYVIDPTGSVSEAKAMAGAPSEAMAGAAVAAMQRFRFKPPGRQGKPCYALLRLEFDFRLSSTQGHVAVTEATRRALKLLQTPGALVLAKELDQRPRVRNDVRPDANGLKGKAVVEMIIDRDGIPRVPRVVSASDPALGFAAVQAVSNWRFHRPMAQGKYVDTLARIPFNFK